jgi:hypothetical protein
MHPQLSVPSSSTPSLTEGLAHREGRTGLTELSCTAEQKKKQLPEPHTRENANTENNTPK